MWIILAIGCFVLCVCGEMCEVCQFMFCPETGLRLCSLFVTLMIDVRLTDC